MVFKVSLGANSNPIEIIKYLPKAIVQITQKFVKPKKKRGLVFSEWVLEWEGTTCVH